MSRPLRIEYANAFYHVMNRGAGRKPVFTYDNEKALFLELLSDAHIQFDIEIHSYCLMTNHYHLLIKTPLPNLSRAMKHINGIYTQRHNRLNCTDGPLFRGRYKSILVDSDAYLIHLSKYIHLNPLAAKMVENLKEYKWSSYPSYINQSTTPNWLFKMEIYSQLNGKLNHAEDYRNFVENIEEDTAVRNFYSKGRVEAIIGRKTFIQNLPPLNQSVEISRKEKLIKRPTLNNIIEITANKFSVDVVSVLYSKRGRGKENVPRKIAKQPLKTNYKFML